MLQLIECRSRDHACDFSKRAIWTNTLSRVRKSEPDMTTGSFHGTSKSTIVDDLPFDRFDTSRSGKRFWTNKDAASGSTSSSGFRVSGPCWRIQLEEEKHECRNQEFLRQSSAVQANHVRREIEIAFLSNGHQ